MAITPPGRRPSQFGSLIASAMSAATSQELQRNQIQAAKAAERRGVKQDEKDRLQRQSDERRSLSQRALLQHQTDLASGAFRTTDQLTPYEVSLFSDGLVPTVNIPLAFQDTTPEELGGRPASATVVDPYRLREVLNDPSRLFTKPGDLLDEEGRISLRGPQAAFLGTKQGAPLATSLLPADKDDLSAIAEKLRVVGLDKQADEIQANIDAPLAERMSQSDAAAMESIISTEIQKQQLDESRFNRAENRRQFEEGQRDQTMRLISTTGAIDSRTGVTLTKPISTDDATNFRAAERLSVSNPALSPEEIVNAIPGLGAEERARLMVNFTEFTPGSNTEAELIAQRSEAQTRLGRDNKSFVELSEKYISGDNFEQDNAGRGVTSYISFAADVNNADQEARTAFILLARDARVKAAGKRGDRTDNIVVTEDFIKGVLDDLSANQSARLAYLFEAGKIPNIQQGGLGFAEIQRLSGLGPSEFLLDPEFFRILEIFADVRGSLGDFGNGNAETGRENLRLQATISGMRMNGLSAEAAANKAGAQLPEGVSTEEELVDVISETSISDQMTLNDPDSTYREKLRAGGVSDQQINQMLARQGATTETQQSRALSGMVQNFVFTKEEYESGEVTPEYQRALVHRGTVYKLPPRKSSDARDIYTDFLGELIEATTWAETQNVYDSAVRRFDNEIQNFGRNNKEKSGELGEIQAIRNDLKSFKEEVLNTALGWEIWRREQQRFAIPLAYQSLITNNSDLFSVNLPQPRLDIRNTIVSGERLAQEAYRQVP